MKHIEKIIMVKRKFNHGKAKKVTTSVDMINGARLKSHWGELTLKEAQRREHENQIKMDGRNW